MKRIFPLLVVVTMLYSLCLPAFAVEDTVDPASSTSAETVTETVTTETVSDDKSVTINVVMPANAETPTEEETTAEDEAAAVEELSPEVAAYATYSLDETVVSEASLPAAIVALFGEYQPRTQTVTEFLSDGTEITYQEYVPGFAGLDWTWIASVSIFAMFLYCVLRAIGGCLKWI